MKLFKKQNYTYSFRYWQAFVIPLLVMVAGCIGSGIFPFGNRSFLRNDLYNQYMPFFQALHDRIWQGEGLSYSFQLGAGSGFAALYGYYLSSPINWLVVLWPRDFIAEFITLVILMKVALAGVSFAYYLRKHFGKDNMGLLFFSSAYALSGFMAAYQWNVMWLDVVWLAPFVLWALEELVEFGKGRKYCLLLAVSVFTNFYLSIMLCIFLVLYFITLILWKPWSVKWRRSFLFAWYSLLGGGMTGVMLLPVYLALSGTDFHEFDFPTTIKWYTNFLEELARHCINVSMKLQADHWPNIYCGVVMFLLIPLFLFNRRISWKEKFNKFLLAAVFLLSFSCNMLDFIWHGFNYPDSLPARQSYLYVWLILVMGYELYLNLKAMRWFELAAAAVLGYGTVILAWIFTDVEGTDDWTYILTLVFLTLYLLLLVGRYTWRYPAVRSFFRRQPEWRGLFKNRYLGVNALVLLLVVTELAANTYLTSIRTVNRTNYLKHYANAEDAVAWMKEQDRDLYRTEIFDRQTKNDSMMWDINTATVFASPIHAGVAELYEDIGMGTTRVSYWYQGATPLSSALLGVRYMIGEDDTMDNALYDVVYSDETGYLYQCNYSLPMGYVIPQDLEEKWNLNGYDPIAAQNRFCRLLGAYGDLLVPIDSTQVDDSNYTISVKEDAYVFVYLGKNSLSEIKLTKGEKSKTFGQVSFDYLLDLGLMTAGSEADLKVVEEDEKFKTFRAYKLNLNVLQEAIDILSRNTLKITDYGENYLKGHIALEESGTLVLPIPIEDGWTLCVNGEERPIESFKEAFMAVDLEPGNYQLEFRYRTPGFKEGLVISGVCVAAFLIFKRRKQKRIQ